MSIIDQEKEKAHEDDESQYDSGTFELTLESFLTTDLYCLGEIVSIAEGEEDADVEFIEAFTEEGHKSAGAAVAEGESEEGHKSTGAAVAEGEGEESHKSTGAAVAEGESEEGHKSAGAAVAEDEDGDAELLITYWEDDNGDKIVPCFTSIEHMGEVMSEEEDDDDDVDYFMVQGHELITILSETETLVVNPGLADEFIVSPGEIKQLVKH